MEDDHSLGAFRAIVDKISEKQIRIFLSVIKDTYLTGKIKKNRDAMFISLAKAYARKNNIQQCLDMGYPSFRVERTRNLSFIISGSFNVC
jgi:hypothetical protein